MNVWVFHIPPYYLHFMPQLAIFMDLYSIGFLKVPVKRTSNDDDTDSSVLFLTHHDSGSIGPDIMIRLDINVKILSVIFVF